MHLLSSLLFIVSFFHLPAPITTFGMAAEYGSIGLLAESYEPFFELENGMTVVFDGEYYKVTEIQKYQALEPNSPYSDFVVDGNIVSAGYVFMKVYGVPGRLVFQTCIERDGITDWGRLFVIAEKQ